VMFDFSFAGGFDPIWSSFSRIVFSWGIMRRVAIAMTGDDDDGKESLYDLSTAED